MYFLGALKVVFCEPENFKIHKEAQNKVISYPK
jgi:hypothetical protein